MRRSHTLFIGFLLAVMLVMGGLWVLAQDDLPLYALPGSTRVYSSGTMALSSDGRTVVAANMFNNTVSFVQPLRGLVLAEVPVGRGPRTVAITPDTNRALVVNRDEGTLSVLNFDDYTVEKTIPVGILPYAVVTDSNTRAYVSLQGSDEVVLVDLEAGRILESYAVPDSPAGLTLWGDFLYVTHLWSGDLSLVYLPTRVVARTIRTGLDTGLSLSLTLDSTQGVAYLPQSRLNAQSTSLTFDTTIWPVVNVVDLRSMTVSRGRRIGLDTADRPVNMPIAAALDRLRGWLFVVNAGSNDLSVIDLNTGLAQAHLEVGANPRGVLLNLDNTFLFVHNVLEGSISVIETRNLTLTDLLPISNLTIPVDILIGAQLFHSAADPRMDANHWISCASCHFDGQSDGRTWADFPGGARNTPVLYDLLSTAPFTWTGEWDELADVELKIRGVMGGKGLISGLMNEAQGDPHAGLSLDMDTLTAYLATLQGPPNPTQVDSELAQRGAAVFAEQGCGGCHAGDLATDLQRHDVGTGGEFDTPSLRWLWMTAPYFHDGQAETLHDVFMREGDHQLVGTMPLAEIDALVNYLLSLP